ncbi:replication-relaxation family protein [Candidatus Uhrbacteria bacterium]|nr:replication-relaxation family protein [Candidatus Uhrbacteria bacterium]
MPPGRTTKNKAIRLTTRDQVILRDLGDYRFLSIPQLHALHFPSKGSAERRLRELFEAGFATRVFLSARPYDRATSTIYALSLRGARMLRELDPASFPQVLPEHERRSALFLDHTLRRNDLRICLELLARQDPGFQLLGWKQAREDVRAVAQVRRGRTTERVAIVPDGAFSIRVAGACHAFAVEIDMGTVAPRRMETRYRAYWTWHRARGHLARHGPAPLRVLTLTTTPSRLERLRQAAITAPTEGREGSGLFWFALLDVADLRQPDRLLRRAWRVARRVDERIHALLET